MRGRKPRCHQEEFMTKITTPPPSAAELPTGHAERLQFSKLIAQNPNYFGNFTGSEFQPVFPLANDTVYEELTCVAENPDKKLLAAVIHVKQATGYSGDYCTPGAYGDSRFVVDT